VVDRDFLVRKARDELDELVKLAGDLVKIPSINPPGDMSDVAGYVIDFFNSIGINYEMIEPKKGVITVYAFIGDGDVDYLHMNGHVDVVPPGDPEKWKYGPFSGVIRDGFLYGRGASDMKGGVAVILKVIEILARYWENIPYRVGVSVVPDEETGSDLGTKYLINELGVHPKYVLIPEPSTIYRVEIGEKGIYHYNLRAEGYPAHASLSPHVGENAIMKLFKVIDEIYKLTDIVVEPPSDLAEIVDLSGEAVANKFGRESLRNLYKTLSCNVGVIKGGDKVNVVAPWAEAEMDMRIPPGMTLSQLKSLLSDILSKYAGVEITSEKGIDPSYTSPSSKLVHSIISSGKEVAGIDIKHHLVAGATDARHFRRVGSEAIIYGPGDPSNIHSYNENISVEDLKSSLLVYVDAVYNVLAH